MLFGVSEISKCNGFLRAQYQKTFDGKDIALRYCNLLPQSKKRRIFKRPTFVE